MILSIKNISHSFGDVSIFKDFSFDWKEDIKRISVWGLNGSGKTTLFKIISGEIKPIKGQIIFQDEDITTLTLFKRNLKGISKTFQIPSPFLGMTVFQNVYLGTLEHEKNDQKRKEKTKNLLEKFKLSHKAKDLSDTLNVMELRLLEMARAFATNPKLILLDECMVGFTEEEIISFIDILTDMQKEQKCYIMMIDHNIGIVKKFCDYMLVLHLGNILIEGTPLDCFQSSALKKIY